MRKIWQAGLALTLIAACGGQGDVTSDTASADQTRSEGSIAEASSVSPPQPDTYSVVTEEIYPAPKKQPNFGPAYGSITFSDTDPGPTIGGTLTMKRAVDASGAALVESEEGISTYMIHWGLEVGAPGTADDAGAGDHGGDCRGFRDTGHVVMASAADLGSEDTLSWAIPHGTHVPEGAVYFVGHTLYGNIHNLGKCTQTPIGNLVE